MGLAGVHELYFPRKGLSALIHLQAIEMYNVCVEIYGISRNGPYIGGHLAFYFKLNFKQVYDVL